MPICINSISLLTESCIRFSTILFEACLPIKWFICKYLLLVLLQLWQNNSALSAVFKNLPKMSTSRPGIVSSISVWGKLSRLADFKMLILHRHCLILSFPTHWKILHWPQIIKAHYPGSFQLEQKNCISAFSSITLNNYVISTWW